MRLLVQICPELLNHAPRQSEFDQSLHILWPRLNRVAVNMSKSGRREFVEASFKKRQLMAWIELSEAYGGRNKEHVIGGVCVLLNAGARCGW
jgi:hypothetical protein